MNPDERLKQIRTALDELIDSNNVDEGYVVFENINTQGSLFNLLCLKMFTL